MIKVTRISAHREWNAGACRAARVSGFTLIELLVVITIILIVSAVALPTVLPALSHRQVSEGARILQAALAGARDSAIRNNSFSGIRLLPDPTYPIIYTSINGTQQIDPTQPLVSNRIVPIGAAPDYAEGLISLYVNQNNATYSSITLVNGATVQCLVVEESPLKSSLPNAPTSWFWNIRVGDKIQINNAGPWYTVVGPMANGPAAGNNEMFVNDNLPGVASNWPRNFGTVKAPVNVNPEYLLLVNGRDDNNNGWTDEGFDGVDNNLAYETANKLPNLTDDGLEWEIETWHGAIASELSANGSLLNLAYTIQRRPVPVGNAREVLLPSNVVIDMSTWGYPFPTTKSPDLAASLERSRLPVNPFSGYVDILVYPNGAVMPATIYSTPSAVSLAGSFLHFWLSERSDVAAPDQTQTGAPYLPLPQGMAPTRFNGQEIKGEYRLVTLFTRTGLITTNDDVPFDAADVGTTSYNTNLPFLQAQQGVRSGQ